MDLAEIVVLVVVAVVIIALCSYCCRRHRGKVLGPPQQTGLTITTATTAVHPPYPVAPPHAVPAPGLGFRPPPHQAGYPYPIVQAPGPRHPAVLRQPGAPPAFPAAPGYHLGPMSMPQPYSGQQAVAVAPPPPYHEAVAQPPRHESYAKQAPYNPDF